MSAKSSGRTAADRLGPRGPAGPARPRSAGSGRRVCRGSLGRPGEHGPARPAKPPNPSSAVGRSGPPSARVPGAPSPIPCRPPAGTAVGSRTAGSSAAARLRSWMAAGRWAGSRRSAAASSSAIGAGHPGQVRLAVHDPVEDRLVRSGAERRPPGRGEGHGGPPGVHVRERRAALPLDDLRRQVAGRAHEHAGHGQPGRVQGLGDAEVDHHRVAVHQHHVARLEVAVHHARRVDRGQGVREPGGQPDQPGPAQRALLASPPRPACGPARTGSRCRASRWSRRCRAPRPRTGCGPGAWSRPHGPAAAARSGRRPPPGAGPSPRPSAAPGHGRGRPRPCRPRRSGRAAGTARAALACALLVSSPPQPTNYPRAAPSRRDRTQVGAVLPAW